MPPPLDVLERSHVDVHILEVVVGRVSLGGGWTIGGPSGAPRAGARDGMGPNGGAPHPIREVRQDAVEAPRWAELVVEDELKGARELRVVTEPSLWALGAIGLLAILVRLRKRELL